MTWSLARFPLQPCKRLVDLRNDERSGWTTNPLATAQCTAGTARID